MNRRNLLESFLAALALGGIFALVGCGKKEAPARMGNQEKLWKLASSPEQIAEPLELPYAKGTEAAFRDSSLAKEDPNFVPKTGGG